MKSTKHTLKRWAIAVPTIIAGPDHWQLAALAAGKDQPGPITFSSLKEAQADLRFQPRHKGVPVEITITFKL